MQAASIYFGMAEKLIIVMPSFYYGGPDINDGKPWSEQDVADLRAAVESGSTLEKTAAFLCRSGTWQEVERKAKQLGLKFRTDRKMRHSPKARGPHIERNIRSGGITRRVRYPRKVP